MTQTWDCTRGQAVAWRLRARRHRSRRARAGRRSPGHLPGLPGRAGRPGRPARRCWPGSTRTRSAGSAPTTPSGQAADEHRPRSCSAPCSSLAEARRRRNRWRYLAAAAAVVAIAGGLFGGLKAATSHDHPDGGHPVARPGRAAGKPRRGRARPPGRAPPSPTPGAVGQRVPGRWSTTSRWGPRASCGWSTRTGPGPRWPPGRRPGTRARSGTRLDAGSAGSIGKLPDHRGEPGAAHGHADLTPSRLAGGNGWRAPVLSMGVTGGMIALAAALAVATVLGVALRRRAGRFRRPRPPAGAGRRGPAGKTARRRGTGP